MPPDSVDEIVDEMRKHKGVTLHAHQVEGLHFLATCYANDHGCILADEMGVGKTLQAIALLSLITAQNKGKHLHHLVVCPLSVVEGWNAELSRGAIGLSWKIYRGDKEERDTLRGELVSAKQSWNVLITTYELYLRDAEFYEKFAWCALIVDEAHRLKNNESLVHKTMQESLHPKFILLMTGTPIQNNLDELYSLLSFCAPNEFPARRRDAFLEEHKGSKAALKKLLTKFMLRRTKSVVCTQIPFRSEIVVYHGMSALQKRIYRAILLKNYEVFETAGSGEASKQSLMNTLMHLKKCADHPYLFNGVEPEPFEAGEHLVEASGKFVVLDRLLAFLHKNGHRVLLFSQMSRVLDIIQDYLTFRGYAYERLDGSVRGDERYAAIKRFQDADSDEAAWIFMLTTKAGGVGLNLTGADTVVFIDSDFNPQNDVQAAARSHRIGQTKPVKVIRLVGKHTVEEVILARAARKLKLSEAVMDDETATKAEKQFTSAEVVEMLMFGLSELSKEATSKDTATTAELEAQDEEYLERVIGGTDENGEWVAPEVTESAPKAGGKAVEAQEVGKENIYMFEGLDYSAVQQRPTAADEAAASELVATALAEKQRIADEFNGAGEAGTSDRRSLRRMNTATAAKISRLAAGGEERPLTAEELAAAARKRDEAAQKRREKVAAAEERRRAAKLQRWKEQKYVSTKIADDEAEEARSEASDELRIDEDEEEDVRNDLVFVHGDVAHPKLRVEHERSDALIVHCVDDSGQWPKGGVFGALAARSDAVERAYKRAADMDDLELGDAHVVPCDDRKQRAGGHDFAVLIVAQHRNKKGVVSAIDMNALEEALRRVAAHARRHRCSVHLPRIGFGTPAFNWYRTERLLRKLLAQRGVPTYVYYFSRRAAGPSSSATVGAANSSAAVSPSADDVPSLPDFLRGQRIFLADEDGDEATKKRSRNGRFVVAFGGELATAPDDEGVTHVVVDGGDAALDRAGVDPAAKVVKRAWLEECFRRKKLVETTSFEV